MGSGGLRLEIVVKSLGDASPMFGSGLGFGVWALGFGVLGLRFEVQSLEFGICCSGCRV